MFCIDKHNVGTQRSYIHPQVDGQLFKAVFHEPNLLAVKGFGFFQLRKADKSRGVTLQILLQLLQSGKSALVRSVGPHIHDRPNSTHGCMVLRNDQLITRKTEHLPESSHHTCVCRYPSGEDYGLSYLLAACDCTAKVPGKGEA